MFSAVIGRPKIHVGYIYLGYIYLGHIVYCLTYFVLEYSFLCISMVAHCEGRLGFGRVSFVNKGHAKQSSITKKLHILHYVQFLLEHFILISACSGRQLIRSASRGDFVVPHARTAINQHGTFSILGPSAWNSLTSELHSLPQILSSSFYKLLKTFIFAWAGSASE